MTRNNSIEPVAIDSSQLAERMRSATGLLLGCDFDGTLAPIAEDPDEPTISDPLARALQTLATREDVRVAIISGRELDDLLERVGIDGVT